MHIARHIYVVLYQYGGSTEYGYRGCPCTRLTTGNSIFEYLYSAPTVGTPHVASARFPDDWYLFEKASINLEDRPVSLRGQPFKIFNTRHISNSGLARSPEIPLSQTPLTVLWHGQRLDDRDTIKH